MLRPPTHRADAPIVFIHPHDDAWDHERIDRDLKDAVDHPMQLYFGGHTRYDLTAEVISYLKSGARPTKFFLRRLHWDEWLKCKAMWERSVMARDPRAVDAYVEACRLGLTKIEDGPELHDSTGSVSYRDMQRLQDLSTRNYDLVLDIGQAVYQASMPLSAAEKKA